MVIESTTMQYHIMEEPATRENIIKLLEDLVSENIPMKGGNSYFYRVQRAIYEIFSSLANMYRGNPILTVILIGLPFAFLSIIIYTSCCTDILDAKDEDEEELLQQEEHEKHD
ncbi:hypothetical protein HDE_12052 [Halotydeus destructor]|nr:hypothetical protein HDE_12052 [Halotydeus destructor]